MKKNFLKRYRHVAALMAVCVMAFALVNLGLPLVAGLCIVALWQISQLAMSKRCGVCFNTVLTPEQVKEFGDILKGINGEWKDVKDMLTRFPTLQNEVNTLRRSQLGRSVPGIRQRGKVSDDCARGLASAVVLHAARSGKIEAMIPDSRMRDAVLIEARSFAGVTTRDMSTSEIPLPVVYGTELIELIAEFGVARREMMIYPMSGGQNRPPRWGTRPAFGAIAMAALVTEKKPTLEFCDLTSKKLGGLVIMPHEIDQQSLVPMGHFLALYGAVEFARAEDTWAFLADGTATYEGVEGLCKIADDNSKSVVLGAGKTKPSDATLENFRALRRKVNTAALSGGRFYMNQSWEGFLRSFNTINDPQIFAYRPDGTASLDGFPIVWTEVLQPYQDTAAASANLAVFGKLKFWLMGQRGVPRVDTSEAPYFIYDMIATRFIEQVDFDYLSIQAASVLRTAAS